jgi:hypothetical protein
MGLGSIDHEYGATGAKGTRVGVAGRQARLVVLVLSLLGGGIALARLHTWDEPLERDLTTYAVIGHHVLQGRSLYSDLWDHKPPAIHLSYAIAEYLFGYGRSSVYALSVSAAILTMLGIFAAASSNGDCKAGLWAAAFWATLCNDVHLQGNQPNAEVFMNACLTGAFALLLRCRDRRLSAGQAILAGILFFWATAYKQIVVAVPASLALAHIACPPAAANRRQAAADVALIAAIGVFGWLGIFAYFHLVGHTADFVDAVFSYNRFYAGHPIRALGFQFEYPQRVLGPLRRAATTPLLLLLSVLAMILRGAKQMRLWALWLAYVLGVDVSVQTTIQAHHHYFQLWLPPLVIGAAWGVSSLSELGPWMRRYGVHLAASAILGCLLAVEMPYYFKSARDWCMIKYGAKGGEEFAASAEVRCKLDELLRPGETFYVWGAETGLYFQSSHPLPTGVLFNYPLVKGPLLWPLSLRVIRDLERSQPALVVTLRKPSQEVPAENPVNQWWRARYHSWPDNHCGPFDLYVRSGSDLERRLSSMHSSHDGNPLR